MIHTTMFVFIVALAVSTPMIATSDNDFDIVRLRKHTYKKAH